jgi:aminodeoxychorismate synthase component I
LPSAVPVFTPARRAYLRLGATAPVGAWVPLAGRTPRDLLRRLAPAHRPFLLESARTGPGTARYSFLGGDPVLTVRSTCNGPVCVRDGDGERELTAGPLRALRELLAPWRTIRPPRFPPFIGGFVGLFSYDLARRFERLPVIAADDLGLPEIDLDLVDLGVAVDHVADRLWVTWLPGPRTRGDAPERVYARGCERVEAVLERLGRPAPPPPAPVPSAASPGPVTANMDREGFMARVRRAKDYIAAGDIFQANLSQRFSQKSPGLDPFRLYLALTRINPSPFAAYIDRTDYQIVSSSPERLVALRGGRVDARPIAGTRPRGGDAADDRHQNADLLASDKERAEHVMLVDLMRNDLGRVCDYGSVRVSEFMTTERYSHVMHIVSNVVGRLGPGMDALALVRAAFPGGTITGAPKVRCMEIIEELEPVRRGCYTGSAGYLSAAGDMDLNILIRTVLVKDGIARFQTGAGVVADSDPAFEYAETLHKAEAMRRALDAVTRGAELHALAGAGSA